MKNIIACVDFGINTGLAIGQITVVDGQPRIEKLFLDTIVDNQVKVANTVLEYGSTLVMVEALPYNSENSEAKQAFYDITRELDILRLGMTLLQPSAWKPFVGKPPKTLKVWEPQTQHEKDAAMMLFYVVATAHGTKDIIYV